MRNYLNIPWQLHFCAGIVKTRRQRLKLLWMKRREKALLKALEYFANIVDFRQQFPQANTLVLKEVVH